MINRKSPPHILLVFADQWTFWALGAAGNTEVRTPHLDALAAQGVYFPCAVSGSPVCTPARASLLTGLRPNVHGLFINDAPLNPELPSMGKHFAEAGYDTAWIGKWHVDGHGRSTYIPPERRQGFETFQVLECTHDYNHSSYYSGDSGELKTWPEYDAFSQTEAMQSWICGRSDEKPFLGVLSWGPPHSPYQTAPEKYKAHFPPERLTVRGNVPAEFREKTQEELSGYYAHCEALDACMGRLMQTLEEEGLRENTLVVFSSDHGDMLQSHGIRDKQCPWDESLRIPMMMAGPGIEPGTQNHSLIEFMDLWPTLAGLAGVPVPRPLHGRDLNDEVRSGGTPEDNSAFYASYVPFGNWRKFPLSNPLHFARESRGLRTPEWLYVEDLKGPWLLYDMKQDPLQLNNLADSPAHADLRQKFSAQLADRREGYQDEFLSGEDYVKRWGYETDADLTILNR
ncbi:sulfatase [Kiritimatiellaeota bacterium B1221]|nr:sulfatase [Kiritimatiellaeota bacterium B1221]